MDIEVTLEAPTEGSNYDGELWMCTFTFPDKSYHCEYGEKAEDAFNNAMRTLESKIKYDNNIRF